MNNLNKRVVISQKNMSKVGSGTQRKVMDEVRVFRKLGYEVYVVAEKINKKMVADAGAIPKKVFRWPFAGYTRRLLHAKLVQRQIDALKPDLVIGHGDIFQQDILYIHNCVHLDHEIQQGGPLPEDDQMGRIHSRILRQGQFKLLICNSDMMKQDLVRRFDLDATKVHVIHPEHNSRQFNMADADTKRRDKRRELGLDDTTVAIGLVTSGQFEKRNVALLLQSARQLLDQGITDFRVIIAGGGKTEQYKKQCQQLEITSHVAFCPAITQVEDYYHALDVFALPAKIEEFGRSVLEAMACGKPVVISSTVGASEILPEASKPFVLQQLDLDTLTGKLTTLIQNPALQSELGHLNQEASLGYSEAAQEAKFRHLVAPFID